METVIADAKKVGESIQGVVKQSTGNELKIVVHNNDASFIRAAEKASGEKQSQLQAKGFYFGKDGSIHLNMPRVTAETMIHEGFHPVLDFILSKSPEKLDQFFNDLKSVKEAKDIIEAAERDYAKNGDRTIKKEAITDFIAKVANGDIEVNNTNFQKIKNYLIGLLNKLGFNLSEKQIVDLKGAKELKDLANLISGKFAAGKKITTQELETGVKDGSNANSEEKVQFQSDFKHKESGIEWRYFKNSKEFKKLVDEGYVTYDKGIDDFNGAVVLHVPDAAFSGDILKDGEIIAKGKGGLYYPLVFHENGDFWAATERGAASLAKTLNEARAKSPDGKVRMILVSTRVDKLMSSSLNGIGLIDILSSKAFSDKSGITPEQLKKSIISAIKTTEKARINNEDGMKPTQKPLPKISGNESLSELKQKLQEFYPAENSDFPVRKALNKNILDGLASYSTSEKVAKQLSDFLGEGSYNEKLKSTGGKLSKANLTEGFSNILAEPTLRGEDSGKMYAVIELAADVKPVRTSEHESYPFTLRSTDPNQKPYVHILKQRDYWYNHIKDTNGELIGDNKQRQSEVLPPSSGISSVVDLSPTKVEGISEKVEKAKPQEPIREFGVGFAPYRDTKVTTLEQDKQARKSPEFKFYQKTIGDVASSGISSVVDLSPTKVEGISEKVEKAKPQEPIREFGVGFAPYRDTKVTTLEQDKQARKSPEFKFYQKTIGDVANIIGVKLGGKIDTWGGYVDSETGKPVQEVSNVMEVTGTPSQMRLMAAVLGKVAPEMQNSILVGEYASDGKGIEHIISTGSFENANKALNFLKSNGLEYFSIDKKTGNVIILDDTNTQKENIDNFIIQLNENGIQTEHTVQPVNAEFIYSDSYDRILSSEGSKIGEQNRRNLDAVIEKAGKEYEKIKQKYDKENKPRISSEIGIGEKPIETESVEGGGAQKTGGGGIFQAPGIEGEGKETTQFSKVERDDISSMKDILKEYVDEGYDLNDIKEIMQDEFGSDYAKEERIIEQAYNELTTTSIKNKTVIKERAERGLPDVEMQAKRDFGTVLDNANKMVEKGEIVVPSLVNEIIAKPRPLKAEESAALLAERMKMSKQYNTLMSEILDAQDKGEMEVAAIKESQLKVIEENMALNDEAARKAGYEQGLGLAARRMLIAQDYSLATQMVRMKAANGGKELPKEYKERLTTLVRELETATADLERQEEKKIADDIIKQIASIKIVKKPKEQVEKERQSIKDRIVNTWNSFVKGVTGKGEEKVQFAKAPQVSPLRQSQLEAVTPDVKKLVKSYAEAGITDINDIIDGVHQDIKSVVPGITKDEVRDVIAEKYKVKQIQAPLTSKQLTVQANVKKVKAQIEMLKNELELEQRTKGQKTMDYLQGWHRFAILSGIPSIGKIGTAVVMRGVTSRTEGLIGKALSYIPGIRQIAKGAIREGDIKRETESKAFSTYFDEMTKKDIGEVLKGSGISELDYLYGDKTEFASKVPDWMEFFGRMHSAMKLLPKRAEFFRSLEMRSQRALEEGKDLNDPNVQMELGTAAYNDALRAVFMQDNYVTDAYKALVTSLEKSNIQGAKESATVLKFLLPIIKVPTNYVAEESSYLLGGVKALYAIRKGVSEMTPEQKDFFMRALKKQTIGAAFMMLGYANPQAFGGYYTGKRKKDDLQAADIELFGVHVPHWLSHSPLFEMLQVGATLRRVSDTEVAKGNEPSKFAGIPAVIKGMTKQVPFASATGKGVEAFENGDTFGQYVTQLGKGILIPQLVQNISDFADTKEGEVIKRLPTNWKEELLEATPFRKKLEAKKELFSKEELEEPNFKLLQEKGIEVPFIRERLKIKIVQDENHPDGVMTPEEYEKYSESLNKEVKKGISSILSGTYQVKEGNKYSYVSGKKLEGKDLEDKVKKIEGEVSSDIIEKMGLTPKEKKRTVTKLD